MSFTGVRGVLNYVRLFNILTAVQAGVIGSSPIPRKRMGSAGAWGVRVYGGLFWCPRFDEFREQNRIESRLAQHFALLIANSRDRRKRLLSPTVAIGRDRHKANDSRLQGHLRVRWLKSICTFHSRCRGVVSASCPYGISFRRSGELSQNVTLRTPCYTNCFAGCLPMGRFFSGSFLVTIARAEENVLSCLMPRFIHRPQKSGR